ncbi:MAG: transposase [Lacunisphaera sp.]|nr:transposase [Lacunisphaera sp.]
MHLPHLPSFSKQPLLFITTCTAGRHLLLATASSHDILKAIWSKSAALDGWYVGHYLLMPDHLHLFAVPGPEAKPLAIWIKSWKSISSRQLAITRAITPPVWQGDYFDHFVRSRAAYRLKWTYVQQNPVRQGLCVESSDWLFQGTLHDIDCRLAG